MHAVAGDGDVEAGDDAVAVEQPVVHPLPLARLLLLVLEVAGGEEAAVEEVDPAGLGDVLRHRRSSTVTLRSPIVTRAGAARQRFAARLAALGPAGFAARGSPRRRATCCLP